MDLARLRYRRLSRRTRDDLYDAAYGPPPPAVRRPVRGEWDDPTWIAVEADVDWMAEETERVEREERWALRRERETAAGLAGHHPRDDIMDAVLNVLAAGPTTAAGLYTVTGYTPARVGRSLKWLIRLGDVRVGWHRDTYYRLAGPDGDAAWTVITAARKDRPNRTRTDGRRRPPPPDSAVQTSGPPPRPRADQVPLFPQDLAVLNVLAEADDLTMGQLADRATRVGVSGMALPVILRGLVAKGLVSQVNDVARGQVRYRLVTNSDLPGR